MTRTLKFPSIVLLILIYSCSSESKSSQQAAQQDFTFHQSHTKEQFDNESQYSQGNEGEVILVGKEGLVEYAGIAEDDEVKKALETFTPLVSVLKLASSAVYIKDSIEMARETQEHLTPKDSTVFMPYVTRANKAIIDYQKRMASGSANAGDCPSLTQLDRKTILKDSVLKILESSGSSDFLSHGKFFFLGGAPFINKLYPEGGEVFTDASGNPETRFICELNDNTNYFLKSFYHHKKPPIKVTFGPPLSSYDMGPQEVNGIGSLIHNFVNRPSVFFLTEKGLIPGYIHSVDIKLVPEQLGCVSDQPKIKLASSENIDAIEILGVYISYDSPLPTSCKVDGLGTEVWKVDLNGDGIPDIAGVLGVFISDITDDVMSEAWWFVNIEGEWKLIDWAAELDCT